MTDPPATANSTAAIKICSRKVNENIRVRKIHGRQILATRMHPAFLLILAFGLLGRFLHAADPSPTDPRLEMRREITVLRTARALASVNPSATDPTILQAREKAGLDLVERYPTEAEPLVVYGEILTDLGKNEMAFQQWERALQIDPARHDILAAQADLLLQTGQIVPAADALEKAARLDPANADYQYSLAHVYTLFRRDLMTSRNATEDVLNERGTAYFRRAAELAPENLRYAQAYAETFYTEPNPDWALARGVWESLLTRSPEKSFIHSHLVRINIRLGDKVAAEKHLAAMTDPAFGPVRLRLQKQIDAL